VLLQIRTLMIENNGYKRDIYSKNIFINTDHVVSIVDYENLDNFLLSEQSSYSSEKFSIVKISHGNTVEDIITFGSAQQIYSKMNERQLGKRILND